MTDAEKLIAESLDLANSVKQSARKAAKDELIAQLTKDVKNTLVESMTDPAYPAGVDPQGEDPKRVKSSSKPLDQEGEGDAVLEGDEPPTTAIVQFENEGEAGEDGIEEADAMAMGGKPATPAPAPAPEKNDGEMDIDLNLEGFDDDEDDKKEDKKKDDIKETDDDDKDDKKELQKENKALKSAYGKLKKENAQLKEALQIVKKSLQEAHLINVKMGTTNSIFAKYPTLSANTKNKIVESFNKAKDVATVKAITETVLDVLKSAPAKNINENVSRAKQVVASAAKNKATNDANLLNESRLEKLAGIN